MQKRQARLEYRKLVHQTHEAFEAFIYSGETDETWEAFRALRQRRNAAMRAAYSPQERQKILVVKITRCLQAITS